MIRKFFSLSILCLNYFYSQTHFTIPQNVWRISIENEYLVASGKATMAVMDGRILHINWME